jgi:pimeloyl-ACP methyl ester esterase
MRDNLLLLTGWGATCKAWDPIIPALEQRCQVKCVNPPWIKQSIPGASLAGFEAFIDDLGAALNDQKTKLVAWSLGGLIAIQLAKKYSDLIDQIIFIASSPQFVASENFHGAIDQIWFDKFIDDFKKNPRAAFLKFIALQAKGDEFQMNTIRFMKNNFQPERLDLEESLLGLKLLQEQQLMLELQNLQCKKLFIHGDKDAVISSKAAEFAATTANCGFKVISRAGHAPHISHPELTTALINDFLQ